MLAYTPGYHIGYLTEATPLVELAAATKQNAEALDAAMGKAGYTPPDASSFAAEVAARVAVGTRVTALEAAPTRTAPQTLSMNSPWVTFGGGWDPLKVWTEGRTGFLAGFIKPTTALAAGDYAIAGVPAGMRPPGRVSSVTQQGRVDVGADGVLNLSVGAIGANNFLIINMHWSLT